MADVSELEQQLFQLWGELIQVKEEKNQAFSKVEILESEVHKAKESEKKMLESLASQTSQLEKTMISLEEAKIEIKYLNEAMRPIDKDNPNDTKKLCAELSQALQAEEKSKKAMDDLAVVLKEVTVESNNAKKSYFQSQSELESLRAQVKRLRLEAEESTATWKDKEDGFLNCIGLLKTEISYTKKESAKLTESQRSARLEISKMRDIVKQAVNESTVVKDALEIARDENSQLKDLLSEKEYAFISLKQDFECLKVSEAAAVDSMKELSGLLATTTSSSVESGKSKSLFDGSEIGMEVRPMMTKFPSENWKNARWNSSEESSEIEGPAYHIFEPSPSPEKEVHVQDRKSWIGDSPSSHKKKRQVLRKVGDMLRMRSFSK